MQAGRDDQPRPDHAGLCWNQCVLPSELSVHLEDQRKYLKVFIVLESQVSKEGGPDLGAHGWFGPGCMVLYIDHTMPRVKDVNDQLIHPASPQQMRKPVFREGGTS